MAQRAASPLPSSPYLSFSPFTRFLSSFYLIPIILLTLASDWALGGMLYPRESETREVKSLDGIWNFRKSSAIKEGYDKYWYKTPLDQTGDVIPMPVPSSYNDITQDKSLRDHVGTVWYERTFFVPSSWSGRRVWLRFGSVHYTATVWLNGEEVTYHEIGHLPFQVEVTLKVNYGAENRVSVAVDNTLSLVTVPQGTVETLMNGTLMVQRYSFDFFNYAGIHRPVVLYSTPLVYVDDVTVYTDIIGSKAYVYFNVTYGGASPSAADPVTMTATLYDADGNFVGKASKEGVKKTGYISRIEVPEPNFWWPYLMHSDPGYMYSLEVRLSTNLRDEHIRDVYRLSVGIRTLSWTNTSLYINNIPVYLRGFGRHEDSNIIGKGLDLAIVVKDHNLLKWIGANCYRTSHYPYAEEIMDFADREGIMIIDECPSVNTEKFSDTLLENHKSSLTQLIERDKNRPSVIMWSVANEPRTQYAESADYFRLVVQHVRTLDYRPVTAAIAQEPGYEYLGQFLDIIGFNRYNAWYTEPGKLELIQQNVESEAMNWHRIHDKPIIMMEYGADTMAGQHEDPAFVWSEEYQIGVLSEHFKAFDNLRNRSFFIGEMIWNFADFRTDQAITRVGGNKKGVFTRERQPKSAAFHVRRRYHRLAQELDGVPVPEDLEQYTAPLSSLWQQSSRNEL